MISLTRPHKFRFVPGPSRKQQGKHRMRTSFVCLSILVLSGFVLPSCSGNYSPKPRGHFRIDLPEKNYQRFDSVFPYSFEYPVYGSFRPDTSELAEPYWADLHFPGFKGTLHLSYKPIETRSDLHTYLNDARNFVQKHIPKATGIREEVMVSDNHHVYGIYYEIRGREAASPVQFFVTDSTSHFLRGALYFQVTPNNDSLDPVIRFLQEDIRHLINTMEWRSNPL